MTERLICWKCGGGLDQLPLPFGRRDECPACGSDLHVCRMCRFYDTSVSNSCQEPIAEAVMDKERSNFCGYFQAKSGAYSAVDDSEANRSRAELAALFGESPSDAGPTKTPEERAKAELGRLFGLDEDESKPG